MNTKMLLFVCSIFLLGFQVDLMAQQSIQGVVTDAETGEPLPGVNIQLQGTSTGGSTNTDGEYSFTVPAYDGTLIFSFLGYQTRQIDINGRREIDVELTPQAISGDELVVVGYTSQARRTISDAVSTVDADQIEKMQVSTLGEAIKGTVPGVSVTGTGEPGRSPNITIRGASFIGDNTPLFVVDGVYTSQTPNINPDDIESLEILKDASAAAQYGSQAANGVILINTKRGSEGETRVTYRSSFGVQDIPNRISMMGADEWSNVATMAYENAGLTPPDGVVNPQINTDWQDAFFERGSIQNHNLSISGGSENATYLISGSYLKQDGAVVGPEFERYSVRVNSEASRGRITVGESLSLSRSERDNMIGFPFIDVVRMLPSIPVFDDSNESGFGFGDPANPTFGTNPVGAQELEDNRDISNQLIGNLYGRLNIADNLEYKLSAGIQFDNSKSRVFRRRGIIRFNNPDLPANLNETRSNFSSLLVENLLTFQDTFGGHNVTMAAGYTFQEQQLDLISAFRESFSNEEVNTINAGTSNLNNSGFVEDNNLQSLLGRLVYDYEDKYLFSATYRRDGSSRFGEDSRYGNFFSGSVGWVASEEDFYSSIPFVGNNIEFLKFRASYGQLGNQDIGNFQFVAGIQRNLSYLLGGDRIAPGAIQLNLANPDIKWQENEQVDIGLDLIGFNNRFTLTADYYQSQSNDLLVQAPLPVVLGSTSNPFINAGSIQNTGFEFDLGYDFEWSNTSLSVDANLTTIDNEVLSLGNDNQPIFAGFNGISRTAVGDPIGAFYLLQTDGIFQNQAEIDAHGAQPGAKPGDIRFRDLNDDGMIDDEDRSVVGDPFPDFEYGFSVNLSYKLLDLAASFRGVYGNDIFNVPLFFTNRMDDLGGFRSDLDPWTPDNRDTDDPRAVFGPEGASNANPVSDRWLEDGSYLRLQNLELGYTFSPTINDRLGLAGSDVRVFASVQNLFTITGYSNWDPEIVGPEPLSRGVDDARTFPNVRTVSFGINVRL